MLAAVLAFAGVAAVINVTPGLDTMLVLRIAGVLYLSWLGCGALWRSRRRRGPEVAVPATVTGDTAVTDHRPSRRAARAGSERLAAFRSGLTTNLLNPKAGVFYMSLLPQFVPHGAPVFRTAMLLTLIDVAELLIWFCVLSVAAAALAERVNRASFRRAMERISGLVFLGFAVNLAVDRA